MGWNFRIIRTYYPPEICWGIHEVYYDKEGRIEGWTANPVYISESSEEDLKEVINRIQDAFNKPVLDENELKENV